TSAKILTGLIIAGGFLLAGLLIYWLSHWIILFIVNHSQRRKPTLWKQFLLSRKFFVALSALITVLFLQNAIPLFLEKGTYLLSFLAALFSILTVVNFAIVFSSFTRALSDILLQKDATKDKPIKSYAQIVIVVFWAIAVILIISILVGKSPGALLVGLGAFSAVLLLVFQDTITGFVYSIQLASNDLVRNGDWITVNKYDADGTVEEINLISVKVRNFDNTISTIPVKQLIIDSFQNWRGMQDQGMRRIKRSFKIDITTIKPCTAEMLEKFKQVTLLTEYIEKAEKEIAGYNIEMNTDTSLVPNGRHLTNGGILRRYILEYLKHHPQVNKRGTLMVRQLSPSEYGLPFEIYCFADTTEWVKYENIQSDIFDHLYSVLSFFEISAYQRDISKK
ncbi:MAG: mechanosensitive ion channel, partial [Bacteroidales bacterium]|nr:mechanosensitive ion channel [Bacteroidales bacterium]